MSDTLVLVLTALLVLGVPAGTLWAIWRTIWRAPTREQALAQVLGSIAGTALLGVILPAALMGALDPFPIWVACAALSAASATVVAWRWHALAPGTRGRPALLITACVLLGVLAMAAIAVT